MVIFVVLGFVAARSIIPSARHPQSAIERSRMRRPLQPVAGCGTVPPHDG
jgi:hypothetical protein